MPRLVHGLHARAPVHMRDGGEARPAHARGELHGGRFAVEVEPLGGVLREHARRERAEALAEFDALIHARLHRRIARVAEDAAAAERARAEFHAALKPAHDLALRQFLHDRAEQRAIRHAVQGHAAGEREIFRAGQLPRMPRHAEHGLLGDELDGRREIHLPLRERALRRARRAAEKRVERGRGHRQAVQEIEVAQVEAQRAVGFEVEQFFAHRVRKARRAAGREAHEFVFAAVHAEAAERRDRRVEQPERMRKRERLEQLDF